MLVTAGDDRTMRPKVPTVTELTIGLSIAVPAIVKRPYLPTIEASRRFHPHRSGRAHPKRERVGNRLRPCKSVLQSLVTVILLPILAVGGIGSVQTVTLLFTSAALLLPLLHGQASERLYGDSPEGARGWRL
jgi:hypothetical protein